MCQSRLHRWRWQGRWVVLGVTLVVPVATGPGCAAQACSQQGRCGSSAAQYMLQKPLHGLRAVGLPWNLLTRGKEMKVQSEAGT